MQAQNSKYRSIELFCGAGGLALGLQQAGFYHEALYELNKDCCSNINYNIDHGCKLVKDWKVFNEDVRNINYQSIPDNVTLLSGGPPCQPFSIGGKGHAYNDDRDMFPEAVRAVRYLNPDVFIFENVKGLLRAAFNPYFRYILLQLSYPHIPLLKTKHASWQDHAEQLMQHHVATNGNCQEYKVDFKLVNAADYGVPQIRHRVFIVGWKTHLNVNWQFPEPTHSKESLIYSQFVTGDYWKLHDLPEPKEPSVSLSTLKRIGYAIEHGNNTTLPWVTTRDALVDLPDPLAAPLNAFDSHVFKDGAKVYLGHTGSCLDEPSKTIKAGAHGVLGGENMLVLDDGSVRYFTVRESARIQTFPEDYHFSGSWTESTRQLGNAVPVKLANIMGQSLMTHLSEVSHART